VARDDDDDIEIDWGRQAPLVPDGEYVAKFVGHETAVVFGEGKVFLHFEIVDGGPLSGAKLFRAFRVVSLVGTPGPGGKFRAAHRGDLVATLARVLDINPRRDRITLRPLKSVLLRIRTRTVAAKRDAKSKKMIPRPEWLRYSVVDDVVRVEAGAVLEP
jgi:hypothetical protein